MTSGAETRPSQPSEHPLGYGHQPRRLPTMENLETLKISLDQRAVDAIELRGHGLFLRGPSSRHVELRIEPGADRDVQGRLGARSVLVANRHRHQERTFGDARDLAGAAAKNERTCGDRNLLALREDPNHAPRLLQKLGGVANGAGSVDGVVQVHTERTDLAEEGKSSEVFRVHHGVSVDPKNARAEHQNDQRIPPRSMVRNDEDRRARRDRPQLLQASDTDLTEGTKDSLFRVARKPRGENRAFACRDHFGLVEMPR